MKVSFLLDSQFLPKKEWHEALKKGYALQVASSGMAATAQNMIYQTWFWLTQAGVSCDLVNSLPKEGIVIFISNTFSPSTILPPELFCVDVVADTRLLPTTHFHLIQNQAKAQWTPHSLFVPHWPQPSLIPRDPKRGSRLEKISFFGDHYNLAPELKIPAWIDQLRREAGVFMDIKDSNRWHDYSDTDAILAIRDFSRSPYYYKPATKLYNAWLAGVPFIGGRDSAYAMDGKPGIDYLVATSPQQVIEHLCHLKKDDLFRQQLIANGKKSGAAFSREAIILRWKKIIQETLPELANKWQKKSSLQKRFFWMTQKYTCALDRLFKQSNPDDAFIEKAFPSIKNYLRK
jgi:hypothetical protein